MTQKLVIIREQTINLPNHTIYQTVFSYESPLVTQIFTKDSAKGGYPRRSASLNARQVRNPLAVISLIPLLAGVQSLTLLSQIQISSAIATYDVLGNSSGQVDTTNVNGLLFASKGRLIFDLSQYPTSSVVLNITNRGNIPHQLKLQCAIYQRK